MSRYHFVRGDAWHLGLAPRSAGGALYLSRADALRRYVPAAPDDGAGVAVADLADNLAEDLAEPATLHAAWTRAGGVHVFRAVLPADLAQLAYHSTAEQLVYRDPSLTAPPARYVASPRGPEAAP